MNELMGRKPEPVVKVTGIKWRQTWFEILMLAGAGFLLCAVGLIILQMAQRWV